MGEYHSACVFCGWNVQALAASLRRQATKHRTNRSLDHGMLVYRLHKYGSTFIGESDPMDVRTRYCASAIVLLAGVCAASIPPQTPGRHVRASAVSDADWTPPLESRSSCAMQPPRPLATPLPSLRKSRRGNLRISFVIGIDGRLHKVAVVRSAGPAADSQAINTLRQWRYKPATCNGEPVEAEGTVVFSGNN